MRFTSRRKSLANSNSVSDRSPISWTITLKECFAIGLLGAIGFLIRFPGILSNGFLSDESVYVYAAYAISRGVTPYTQIMLPHPPIGYLFLVPAVLLAQGDLLVIRVFNLCTFLIDAGIAYWLFRILRRKSSASFSPLLAFAMLVLYPVPFATTTPLEFTLFDIPILLATVLFAKGLIDNSMTRMAFSGALLGIAIMIWFTALFFAFSLAGFMISYWLSRKQHRDLKLLAKQAGIMLTGGVAAIYFVLGIMTLWAALPNFIVQSIGLQTSLRASFTFDERLYHVGLATVQLLPIFIVASIGIIALSTRVRSGADPLILLPAWVVLVNLVLVFTVPRIVLNHYVAYLIPFLVFLAAGPLERFFRLISQIPEMMVRLTPKDILNSGLTVLLIVSAFLTFPYTSGYLTNSPYTLADQAVGNYVASITLPGNAIWTSEGSIAYFSARLIQPPNSTRWPFQAEYNDIFNATYVDADGVTQKGLGAVSPSQFISAWQSHNTKVLIFILGNGPVPYPDSLLWYGFAGTTGVMNWTESNYNLVRSLSFSNDSYQYNVWLRK